MSDTTFVLTCKGRLHHVRETLPKIVAQSPRDISVVDYDCPDRVGDWVESHFPSVRVVRVRDVPGFFSLRDVLPEDDLERNVSQVR